MKPKPVKGLLVACATEGMVLGEDGMVHAHEEVPSLGMMMDWAINSESKTIIYAPRGAGKTYTMKEFHKKMQDEIAAAMMIPTEFLGMDYVDKIVNPEYYGVVSIDGVTDKESEVCKS